MAALDPSVSLSVPDTILCAKCNGIFSKNEWSFLNTGWSRRDELRRGHRMPWEEAEPAFGTVYTHGMKPYVWGRGAPPTLSYSHHKVAELRKFAAKCPLCRLVLRIFDSPERPSVFTPEYNMHGRKWHGKDLWSHEEVEGAQGYVFVLTHKGRESSLIFRYFVDAEWASHHPKGVNPNIGEREGMKDVTLTIYGK